MPDNKLFFGDNLDVLRRYVSDDSIDLVYLDPPFKSQQDYNVLFEERSGDRSAAQVQAFEDTWRWDVASARTYEDVVERGGDVSRVMQAFRTFLGPSDMLAYLSMMAPRLIELRRVMKQTASLYLHCDPTASHYLKLLLDAVFEPTQFRNEVIWRRTGSHNSARRFGPIHDTLFFYSKSDSYFFKRVYRPYLKGHTEGYFTRSDDRGRYWRNALTGSGVRGGESGQPWKGHDPTPAGRHWAVPGRIVDELGLDPSLGVHEKLDALDDAGFIHHPPSGDAMPTYKQYLADSPGMPIQDIWAYQPHTQGILHGTDEAIDEDVRWLVAQGDTERLGFPTQKPKGLLERIIRSSCPEDGVVLDPFCGCGTTIAAAQELDRAWIGIDITHLAINLIKHRLKERFGDDVEYEIIGEPVSESGASALAQQNRHQFEWWALSLVGARPSRPRRGADQGIDGRLYFHDEPGGKTKQVILSVKSGSAGVSHVRDLRGVVDREGAAIGALISLQEPTGPMKKEAASAGFYDSPWGRHPKIQLLTVGELLDGAELDYPPITGANVTYKRAPKYQRKVAEQLHLEDAED